MTNIFNSLNTAIRFTQKGKHAGGDLMKVTCFREAEYRRYVQAAQLVYPMWVYILNERTEKELRVYANLAVKKVGYMIYRLYEIHRYNYSAPLFSNSELVFMLDTLNEMYNNLLELTAPDAVGAFFSVLLENPAGHGSL